MHRLGREQCILQGKTDQTRFASRQMARATKTSTTIEGKTHTEKDKDQCELTRPREVGQACANQWKITATLLTD